MNEVLHLSIITPSSTILDVPDAEWVQLSLADGGSIGIWPLHSPLLAESVAGTISYADQAGEQSLVVASGILTVRDNQVTIMTVDADPTARETQGIIDAEGVQRYQRLEQSLYTVSKDDV